MHAVWFACVRLTFTAVILLLTKLKKLSFNYLVDYYEDDEKTEAETERQQVRPKRQRASGNCAVFPCSLYN